MKSNPVLLFSLGPILSIAVSLHSVSHHILWMITELYMSDSPSEAFTLTVRQTIESCISDVKSNNKLQLNDNKTDSFV